MQLTAEKYFVPRLFFLTCTIIFLLFFLSFLSLILLIFSFAQFTEKVSLIQAMNFHQLSKLAFKSFRCIKYCIDFFLESSVPEMIFQFWLFALKVRCIALSLGCPFISIICHFQSSLLCTFCLYILIFTSLLWWNMTASGFLRRNSQKAKFLRPYICEIVIILPSDLTKLSILL